VAKATSRMGGIVTRPVSPSNSGFTVEPGFALVALGALIAILSTFLPWEESPSFRAIEHNTLIQQGGWILIALSLGAAASAYGVKPGQTDKWWGPLILAGLCAGFLLIEGSSSETLYPVKLDGTVDTSQQGVTASHGIAIYVAWLGVAFMGIGARVCRASARSGEGTEGPPEAASSTTASKPEAGADKPAPAGKATKIRCFKCQHIQQVPVSVSSYECEECGQRLTRKKTS
jgi:ribosomal protein S27E